MDMQVIKPLDEKLARLEKALDTPVIAGEMPQWCETAEQACAEVSTELERTVRENHTPLLAEIFEMDPEQANHVEQLKKTDEELQKQVAVVQRRLAQLCDAADVMEPDERRVADRVETIVQAGLQLVMAIRRQEVALTTWYEEAFERDRGVAD